MACGPFLTASDARLQAGNNLLIWEEICELQTAILTAIENNEFEVTVSTGTPMTYVNSVLSAAVTAGGSNYAPIVATASISHPTGINATLTPIITGGQVTDFTITAGGTGYNPIPATIDATGVGNGDATLTVTVTNGVITSVGIAATGTGYAVNDSLPVIHPSGINADIRVGTINLTGGITTINIVNGGTGYATVVATVSVTHPQGTGFVGVVSQTGGIVDGVTITNGGAGYEDLVATAVISDTSGVDAEATVTVTAGAVSAITITAGGYGYSNTPSIAIIAPPTSSGAGATATLTTNYNVYGLTSPEYYDVYFNGTVDRVKTYQIEKVISYFEDLDYTIRVQQNPDADGMIQWFIQW